MTLKTYKHDYGDHRPASKRKGGLQSGQFKTSKQKRSDWKKDIERNGW